MLRVNEIFGPTIQGEGRTAGKETMFLRLSGCNLHCIWCDTPYTWNWKGSKYEHESKYDISEEMMKMTCEELFENIVAMATDMKEKSLVITGGEPLLQQKELLPLVKMFKDAGWWIEIETNGTIMPEPKFIKYADQINCSPKLSNSGNSESERLIKKVLYGINCFPQAIFKFVITNRDDLDEIFPLTEGGIIDPEKVYLMPKGMYKDELMKNYDNVKALCDKHGFNFSERLHVTIYGGKRGV